MRPSEILEKNRQNILNIFDKYPRLDNLRVFGSVARGEDTDTSDIDFLVKPLANATLFDMGGLYSDLSEIFGENIDIVSERALKESHKDDILSEAVLV